MIEFDSLSMKFSHRINSTTAKSRIPNSMEYECLSYLLTAKHFLNANKRLSYEIQISVFCHQASGSPYTDADTIWNKKAL